MLISSGNGSGNILLKGKKWRKISKFVCFLTIVFLVIFLFKPACITAGEEKHTNTSIVKFAAGTENAQSNPNETNVNSAGLTSQAVTSEVILDADKIGKGDAFFRGIMACNPIFYFLDFGTIRVTSEEIGKSYQGNLNGIEHYSRESAANTFTAGMVAIAAFRGYRFLKTQTWTPEWLKSEFHDMKISPQPSGGFVMSFEYRF